MDILEYQAIDLFNQFNIPTMNSCVIREKNQIGELVKKANLSYPLVAKVQIPMGKRGKAGGIRFADNLEELTEHVEDLLHKELLGFPVNEILVVEKAVYDQEMYLSIMLDRLSKKPMIIFSAEGGMDIEELAASNPEKIVKLAIDPFVGVQSYHALYILSKAGMSTDLKKEFYAILKNLYECFMNSDCLLSEINPLVLRGQEFIALDGKVKIDDSAIYRLPKMQEIRESLYEEPLVREARHKNFLYIPVEEGGRVAVMSNGSGMLMSCIDLITKAGQQVAAALDLGGGATADRIQDGLRILFSTEGVDSILINIFGGITRCDEVAQGIIYAWDSIDEMENIVILMEGTNKEKGLAILEEIAEEIIIPRNLPEGVATLVKRMER